MSITFETKCWEKDWEILLKTTYLEKQITSCNYLFDKSRLIINNVENPREVQKYAELAVEKGIIDEYAFAADYADTALKAFHLVKEELGIGYNYSISELVGIFLADTTYLLHFSSDSRFERKNNFVRDGISLLENHPEVAVTCPMWNYNYLSIKTPNWDEKHQFHIGYGFSDQCYLIRTEEFKGDIYHYQHDSGRFYPDYGGELFEKRCNAYMRCNNRHRAVYMHASYWTENLRGLENYKKSEKKVISKSIKRLRNRFSF